MEIHNFISSLGWTIINSLWQGLFILIILAISLVIINPRYSKIRALLAYASLIFVFAASIRTFSDINKNYFNQSSMSTSAKSVEIEGIAILTDKSSQKNIQTSNSNSVWNGFIISISNYATKSMNYIVFIWFAGIIFLTLKMVGGYYYMQKIRNKNLIAVENIWINTIELISRKLHLSKSVELFESTTVKFPTLIGYFKPVILMPLGSLSGLPADQVEMILAHELAHIKRSDYLLNIMQSILEILYFFNPAVWVISKIIRVEREYACDDLALEVNSDSSVLAKALLAINQSAYETPAIAISALGTKNSLLGRIKRMTQKNNKTNNLQNKFLLSASLIGILLTITIIACSSSAESYSNHSNINSASVISAERETSNADVELFNNINNITEIEPITNDDIITIEEYFNSSNQKNGKRKFNFHKDDVHWKGTIEDGKLVTLYKDGERISDENMSGYEDFILDTIAEIDEDMAELEIDMKDFKIDMKQLKEDLADLKVDVDLDHIHDITDHFQSSEFKNEMKKLKHELAHLKDIDFDFNFDFDDESFKESMKELKTGLKDLKINMSDLDIDLSDLKVDLKNLKVEMKKLKNFLRDLRDDLYSEGYINDLDEDFDLDLNKRYVTVEGEKLPDNLHKRYLEMYKEHFGKDLDDNFHIHR